MSAIVLALLLTLASPSWSVEVRAEDGSLTESYTAVTKPEERGSRLVFEIEVPREKFASGSKRREVSVPSARATVREVRVEPRPFESR